MNLLASRSVVVAESSPRVAAAIAETFAERGFAIQGVLGDGVAALRSVRKHQPGIITLDLVLPRLSGLRLALEVSALPNPPLVIVISAVSARARIAQAKEAGVRFYLLKPVATGQLRSLLDRHWMDTRAAKLAR